jgi:hypothetical protein
MLLSDISAKVLNSTEDAHMESMSTFQADEHLQARRTAILRMDRPIMSG